MTWARFVLASTSVVAVILGYAGCSGEDTGKGATAVAGTPGSGGSSAGGSTGSGASGGGKGGIVIDGGTTDPDAFWALDPPPPTCVGGASPPSPTGTPECPGDKNRQGCACFNPGATAPCWPGLRKNRNRGQCRDGTAVCETSGEVGANWGGCNGFVLPQPGATSGPEACQIGRAHV